MKIGILGAGNVGSKLATLALAAGHDVIIGRRNGAPSLEDAASHGDIVIIAVHYHAVAEMLPTLTNQLEGKIVVDATNPLNDDWSPHLLGQDNSAAEELAKLLPNSILVKAFNTIFADVMIEENQNRSGQQITAFVTSDDKDAVIKVATFASSIGFSPVTITKLMAARYLEAMAHLNIELAIGQGGGTNAAFLYHQAK
jgi:predicted dinucleotide-binding enzyme